MGESDLQEMRADVLSIIEEFGAPCRLDKADGTSASMTGAVTTVTTNPGPGGDDYITGDDRLCYLPGGSRVVPEPGDTVTFKPNAYVVKDVTAYSLNSDVFAYRLVVGT